MGGDAHVRLYWWEIESAAYRSLRPAARALLVELKALFNGLNNGELFLSVREAAKRLGCGKNLAAELFEELQDRGFIRPNEVGAFNMKSAARRGKATTWILTEHPLGNATAGTREFMRWQPTPSTNRIDGPSGRDGRSPSQGQCPLESAPTVPVTGTVSAKRTGYRSPLEAHR